MRAGYRWIVLSLCAVVMTGMVSSCSGQEDEAPEPVRPVLSQVVKPVPLAGNSFAGTVNARVQTDLAFRVAGRLVAREVDVGDLVKKGQLLATLDATTFDLAIRASRADLSSAEATLTNATAAEERMKALLQSNTTAQATVESAEQTREAAQASLARAQASLRKVEEQLSYTQIRAEFDGVVTATGAEVGQVVAAGNTIVSVARPDERDAVVDVPNVIGGFRGDELFDVALQINPAIHVNGKVREIAPTADETTRTRRIKIALDNPPDTFRLGTTITATLKTAVHEAIIVPPTAVFERDQNSFVWVVDEAANTVSAVPVTVGSTVNGGVIIRDGLTAGRRVVTAGVNSLKDGQPVKVTGGDSI